MSDDDDAETFSFQLPQHAEQHIDLTRVKAGGRFIQYENLARKIDGAGDGDDLSYSDGIG